MIDHDRIAEVYEGTVGSRDFQRVSRRRIHWMCAQVVGRDVLDVGCSQGIASILLGREGHRVVGIDREREPIRAARERLDQEEPQVRERVAFQIGEAAALEFEDDSFDAVLLGELLEHQLDPWTPLEEARRVLRPGGRIVITTPSGVHPYPDHKDPLYLSGLLERLSPHLSIASIALVERYLGLVAERSKERVPRVWRRALRVAEQRLADQDEAMESLRALVGELREGTRALERSLQDRDLSAKAVEIQRDAAIQRQHELQARLDEVEERAAATAAQREAALRELDETRERLRAAERERTAAVERVRALEAEERTAAREMERMHSEVRGARERLNAIELGHRTALARLADAERDLERERARVSEREALRAAAQAEAERLEAQLAASSARLAEARARMEKLLERLDTEREAAAAARRRAEYAESAARAREQAELDARRANERAGALREEVEALGRTVEALTGEGMALRDTLRRVELEFDEERSRRRAAEARLEAVLRRAEQLEQELAAVQARLGYRVGRFIRRLALRR